MGAAYIFGPQKGASSEMVEILDLGLQNYSEAVKRIFVKDTAAIPGTGAAGDLDMDF